MEKKITFEYEGKVRNLYFTRKTRKNMEERGFAISGAFDRMMIVLPDLFYGAFLAEDKYIDRKLVDAMFEKFTNKKALLEKLVELYNAPFEEMMEDPAEGNGIEWEASF